VENISGKILALMLEGLSRIASVGALLCFSAGVFAQDMGIENQTARKFKGAKSSEEFSINYLLFLPKDYEAKGEKKWPLILFLHGAGERGMDLSRVTMHGPPKIVKTRPDFPFVLVSPQCPNGEVWHNDVLLALLDDIVGHHNVDTNRIYLTGLSMGGFGTWSLGLKNPDRFAALAPICGGGTTLDILLPPSGKSARLKKIPVWAFHGGKDPVVKPEESQRLVDALKKIGNNARLTIYPEAGHDSWTETYNNQELYDWFLQQKLTASKSRKKADISLATAERSGKK
jgi:predicted peptidase